MRLIITLFIALIGMSATGFGFSTPNLSENLKTEIVKHDNVDVDFGIVFNIDNEVTHVNQYKLGFDFNLVQTLGLFIFKNNHFKMEKKWHLIPPVLIVSKGTNFTDNGNIKSNYSYFNYRNARDGISNRTKL